MHIEHVRAGQLKSLTCQQLICSPTENRLEERCSLNLTLICLSIPLNKIHFRIQYHLFLYNCTQLHSNTDSWKIIHKFKFTRITLKGYHHQSLIHSGLQVYHDLTPLFSIHRFFFLFLFFQRCHKLLNENREYLIERVHATTLHPLGNCETSVLETKLLEDVVNPNWVNSLSSPWQQPTTNERKKVQGKTTTLTSSETFFACLGSYWSLFI